MFSWIIAWIKLGHDKSEDYLNSGIWCILETMCEIDSRLQRHYDVQPVLRWTSNTRMSCWPACTRGAERKLLCWEWLRLRSRWNDGHVSCKLERGHHQWGLRIPPSYSYWNSSRYTCQRWLFCTIFCKNDPLMLYSWSHSFFVWFKGTIETLAITGPWWSRWTGRRVIKSAPIMKEAGNIIISQDE